MRPLGFRRFLRSFALCLALLGAASPLAFAQNSRDDIPTPLLPWVPWVLEGTGDARCPLVNGTRTCVWLTQLSIDANASGASFSMQVSTDRKLKIALPGSRERWPEDVQVNRKPVPVLERGTTPEVLLEAGSHSLTGRFVWNSLPESVRVPENVALLALRVNGAQVTAPKREKDGQLWLERGKGGTVEEDRFDVGVHRLIEDGVPVIVHTRLRISAAGKAREVVLPHVLLEGTRPIELHANLPVQLTAEGSLRVQVQAGEYEVSVRAVAPEPRDTFAARAAESPWPEQEIWVFKAQDALRHVELSGAPQIDATRTDLAKDWAEYPAYAMSGGKTLKLETRRRGEPEPAPNLLSLQRTLWLDLDGSGYTVHDSLQGRINQGFRIDLTNGMLGQVKLNGEDQVITLHAEKSGVEVRTNTIAMNTAWRLEEGRNSLPAVAYDQDVQSLAATLNLPPGFMLLGSQGVDRLSGTWLDGWDLFDFFFVLLVSLAVGKLAGRAFFPLALLTLVLTHHQDDAPALAWICLIVFASLLRVVGAGRARDFVRAGFALSLLGMLLVIVPFAVQHVREALYPHLAYQDQRFERVQSATSMMSRSAPEPMQPVEQAAAPSRDEDAREAEELLMGAMEGGSGYDAPMGDSLGKSADYAESSRNQKTANKALKKVKQTQDVDPNQVVQTGPGLPNWNFQSFHLSWSGPVEQTQSFELFILPPGLTRLWSLVSVLLSLGLLLVLVRSANIALPRSSKGASTYAAALALLLGLGTSTQVEAQAQAFPPSDLLHELRTRLLKADACEPSCLSVPTLHVRIEGSRLSLKAQVHAAATTAYRAPGPLESFAPETVRVDGKDALSATRLQDGFLYVRLAPGLHEVELVGSMPRTQSLTLALGSAPHRVITEARDYLFDGLNADGRAEGSLSIRRDLSKETEKGTETQTDETSEALEPWLLVRREVELGLRFRVNTTIERMGATGGSLFVRFPLLPGESILNTGLTLEQGSVLLELPSDTRQISFQSELAPSAKLELRAATPEGTAGATKRPWSETWIVRPSSLYHVRFEGIAPIARTQDNAYEPTYRPWPGESLTLYAEKLPAAEGESVTIDRVSLALSPGTRMEQSTLTLQIRTSHGTNERIVVPENTVLTGCTVDGVSRSARIKDGAVEVHLDPGSHQVSLSLQRATGMELAYSSSELKLSRPLTNVTTTVQMPNERWLLWASGPSWGPAVLFWGYLLVVLLAAAGLGRVPHTPLKTHEWILLGLGLTQVDVVVVLFVVGWLFALAYRARHEIEKPLTFNFAQVMLAMLTVIALWCLAYAVHRGLVVQPDMQVAGQNSSNELLRWYEDRSAGAMPSVSVISLPLWVYKGLMLVWALWLAASLLRWLRWGFEAFRSGGGWKALPHRERSIKTHTQNPRAPLDQIQQAQAELDAQKGKPTPDGDA